MNISRHEKILSIIQEKKSVTTHELQNLVYVSTSTIIRDLIELERLGLIKRFHGGASMVVPKDSEASYTIRVKTNVYEKNIIAKTAAQLIEDGSTIFIDSSSTLQTLIPHLKNHKNLTVITNGLNSAILLSNNTDATIMFVGGQIAANSNSTIGSMALNNLMNFNTDLAIFSASGICGDTICEHSIEQSAIKQLMISKSRKAMLLCDSSKFGMTTKISMTSFSNVDYLITNAMPDNEILNAIKKTKCKLIVAK